MLPDYEQRIYYDVPTDGGGGSGGIKRIKDVLTGPTKRLARVSLSLLSAATLGSSIAYAPNYQYWEDEYTKLSQSGVSPQEHPEEWERVLEGLFKTMPPPEAVEVGPGGYLYEFSLAAEGTEEAVVVMFPKELGGGTQTLSLYGDLTLYVEDPPADCANEEGTVGCEAPMRIVNMREVVHGLHLPIAGGAVEIDFIVDDSMFTPEMFDPDRPHGSVNMQTGKYTLRYALRPTHPILQKMGVKDVGTVVVDERGRIGFNEDGKAVSIEMGGSLTISDGPFEGTVITYGRVSPDQPDKQKDADRKN